MNARKLFYILLGALVLLTIGAGASTYYGNQFLVKQNEKLTALKVESSNLDLVQTSLIGAKKDIELYSPIELIAKTIVPQEKDQATTIREIVQIAAQSNVGISSITFPTSTLGNSTKGTAKPSNTAVDTQSQKVEGLTSVEVLPITITSDTNKPVTYRTFLKFLENLEQNRRTAQVDSITIQPDTDDRNIITFNLILNVYIKK